MREIILNPTHEENTTLEIPGKIQRFPHAKRDSGKALLNALHKLKIEKDDEVKVVRGEGNFTAIRSAALLANAIAYITGCKLFSRKKSEKSWKAVKQILPYYAKPPSITIAKKLR